jgi:hypothetical protein
VTGTGIVVVNRVLTLTPGNRVLPTVPADSASCGFVVEDER